RLRRRGLRQPTVGRARHLALGATRRGGRAAPREERAQLRHHLGLDPAVEAVAPREPLLGADAIGDQRRQPRGRHLPPRLAFDRVVCVVGRGRGGCRRELGGVGRGGGVPERGGGAPRHGRTCPFGDEPLGVQGQPFGGRQAWSVGGVRIAYR